MSECINKYFIYNSEIREVHSFKDDFTENGNAIYEVIRVIKGVPIFLDRHLKRIQNSAKLINKNIWFDEKEIEEKLINLIRINDTKEGNIKFIFFYGNEDKEKNLFLSYFIKYHYPSQVQYEEGVSTILYHGERKNPNAKIINNDFRKKVDEKIKEAQVYEAILVDKSGCITEGSKSNIFMVKDSKVITSPLENVLPGVTREIIINLCKKMGVEILEERVNYNSIKELDGLFISGTSPKVLPIKKVNDLSFESSRNTVVLKITTAYNDAIEEYINFNKI